jgi:hypothetical protein
MYTGGYRSYAAASQKQIIMPRENRLTVSAELEDEVRILVEQFPSGDAGAGAGIPVSFPPEGAEGADADG